VDLRGRQLLQRGVQRGGLAGTGRPGHQDDAVGLMRHAFPATQIVTGEAQLIEVLKQHFRVEDPH
nr:hypothetical protein [Tanacetum cinerariifolium]